MCTRYRLTMTEEELLATYVAELFLDDYGPRYNIAPTQPVPVLVSREGARRVEPFRFGLVPAWAKDPSIGNRLLNARSETVSEKPSFRGAWDHRRRCLVLADGFYEWQAPPSGTGPKTPHLVQMADGRPFGFAGLWERWGKEGDPLFSVTILTTEPNDLIGTIHNRMPVLIGDPEGWNAWVDPEIPSEDLRPLFRPFPAEELHLFPVDSFLNNPRHEGPACGAPA